MSQPRIEAPPYQPELFVNREDLIKLVLQKANTLRDKGKSVQSGRVLALIGERGSGKSWLLNHLKTLINNETGFKTIHLDLFKYKSQDPVMAVKKILVDFLRELTGKEPAAEDSLAALSQQVSQQLKITCEQTVLVAFFDHVFESNWTILGGLESYLLGPIALQTGTLIILAGRDSAPPWNTPQLRDTAFHRLKNFSLKDTEIQLTSQQKERLQRQTVTRIHAATGGNPLGNYLLSREEDYRPALDNALDEILSLFAQEIDPGERQELRPLLESLSVLNEFDEERIMHILDQNYAQAIKIRKRLTQASLARWNQTQGAYEINETVRSLFASYLAAEQPERWEKLNHDAIRLYKKWLKEYPALAKKWQKLIDFHEEQIENQNLPAPPTPTKEKISNASADA